MEVQELSISDLCLLTPRRFVDDRGFFSEVYNKQAASAYGIDVEFVQDNHSLSLCSGTIRGLHFQVPPRGQGKLVRVVAGSIMDVVIDARQGSPHYGEHVSVKLSAENGKQLWVPEGFLHGFVTLEANTEVVYKVTDYYSQSCDGSVLWNDPDLGIEWGVDSDSAVVSEKDSRAMRWKDFVSPFHFEAK